MHKYPTSAVGRIAAAIIVSVSLVVKRAVKRLVKSLNDLPTKGALGGEILIRHPRFRRRRFVLALPQEIVH